MEVRKTALERAFELARSGKCLNLTDIIKKLKSERMDANLIEGKALKKQLLQLIKKAKHST
jgi:hypothetical protein